MEDNKIDLLSLDFIGVHPCINTSTLRFSLDDLINKVIPSMGRSYTVIDLPDPDKIVENND